MRDKMDDDVCCLCGDDSVYMDETAPSWLPYDAWWCPECCCRTEVETRAEYLAEQYLAEHADDAKGVAE